METDTDQILIVAWLQNLIMEREKQESLPYFTLFDSPFTTALLQITLANNFVRHESH